MKFFIDGQRSSKHIDNDTTREDTLASIIWMPHHDFLDNQIITNNIGHKSLCDKHIKDSFDNREYEEDPVIGWEELL